VRAFIAHPIVESATLQHLTSVHKQCLTSATATYKVNWLVHAVSSLGWQNCCQMADAMWLVNAHYDTNNNITVSVGQHNYYHISSLAAKDSDTFCKREPLQIVGVLLLNECPSCCQPVVAKHTED